MFLFSKNQQQHRMPHELSFIYRDGWSDSNFAIALTRELLRLNYNLKINNNKMIKLFRISCCCSVEYCTSFLLFIYSAASIWLDEPNRHNENRKKHNTKSIQCEWRKRIRSDFAHTHTHTKFIVNAFFLFWTANSFWTIRNFEYFIFGWWFAFGPWSFWLVPNCFSCHDIFSANIFDA